MLNFKSIAIEPPTTTALTSLIVLLSVASRAAYSQSTTSGSGASSDCSILDHVQFYFYGVPTNNNGTAVAYPCGEGRDSAGGNGTLDNPLTIAADTESGDFEQCEVLYSPTLRKYLRVKDPCNDCGRDVISVWFGGEKGEEEAQSECKAVIDAPDGVLVKEPSRSYEVNSDPIWDDSTCLEDNVYLGAEGECIEETGAATSTSASSTSASTGTATSSLPTSTSENTKPSDESASQSGPDSLSAGAIAGIVIGSIAAIALVAIAVLMWRRQGRGDRQSARESKFHQKGPVYHEMSGNIVDGTPELDSEVVRSDLHSTKPMDSQPPRYDPVELPANDRAYAGFTPSTVSPEQRY